MVRTFLVPITGVEIPFDDNVSHIKIFLGYFSVVLHFTLSEICS